MNGKEFAQTLLAESDYQINACLKDLKEEDFASRPIGQLMSFKETLEHLTECCKAVQAQGRGEEHSWGTFKFPEGSMAELVALFQVEREKAVDAALEGFETKPGMAKDFLICHEFYHVGQLAVMRSVLQPEWNPYAIYNH